MSIKTISPTDLHNLRNQGKARTVIDVRTPAEYGGRHAAGATLVPLDDLDPKAVLAGRAPADTAEPIYLICRSGARSTRAAEKFIAAGFQEVYSVVGGTDAWAAAGLPVEGTGRSVLPLDQQVMLAAGSINALGLVLAWQVHTGFIALSVVVACGLMFAGLTGICPMRGILARMPWNQRGGAPAATAGCACG
jgi:rhodanese-related sulfurtransferase